MNQQQPPIGMGKPRVGSGYQNPSTAPNGYGGLGSGHEMRHASNNASNNGSRGGAPYNHPGHVNPKHMNPNYNPDIHSTERNMYRNGNRMGSPGEEDKSPLGFMENFQTFSLKNNRENYHDDPLAKVPQSGISPFDNPLGSLDQNRRNSNEGKDYPDSVEKHVRDIWEN